ncbi:MAG TPA: cytochrome c [Candidatus Limnocylindria bacterium]|nr:cytochrome c [Candidatus Limnocylindria bacterium]
MRLKTLGVILLTALAIFTAVAWLTDTMRRDQALAAVEEEQLEYGEIVFGPPDANNPATANCAQCHGPDGRGGGPDAPVQGPNLHGPRVAERLKINPNYVSLVIRYGGIVVSGNPESQMPAWSTEVGGPLTEQQIQAVTALVTSWAEEAASESSAPVENTVEAGAQVYQSAGCGSCHGADLAGVEGQFPNIQNIGSELVTDLPIPPADLDQMQADYDADPRDFLTKWIRDSWTNYNGGETTGMPQYPDTQLPDDQLEALITFLLEGEHGS